MRRRALPILVSLAGACLIGLLVYGVSTQAVSRTLDERVLRGEAPAAPDASHVLPRLSAAGRSSLASMRGKVVVLNFWASWCAPCQIEAPLLERAQSRLLAHDATVLGVTYKDASNDSEAFVRQFHITYPSLRDGEGAFAKEYGTDQLPETFIIDRRGRVVKIARGEIDQAFVDHAIAIAQST